MTKVRKDPFPGEYQQMFDSMIIDESKRAEINDAIELIESNQYHYVSFCKIANKKMPYYAIAIAHYMEADCSFLKHIHNGDSLLHKTVNEPVNRPDGEPPFTWEQSALDWVKLKQWNKWESWGVPQILYRLEANNGFGYRNREMATPYLWSYTNFYQSGKFVSDGKFDSEAVSKQVGAAILLKHFINQ
jgi:lysozyme family protein